MKYILLAMGVMLTASCVNGKSQDAYSACPKSSNNIVCQLPIEAVLSNRNAYFGRKISLDGVLILVMNEEPPGTFSQAFMLFPSKERAELCNQQLAIRVLPTKEITFSDLRLMNGRAVSVAGRFAPSEGEAWGYLHGNRISLLSDPSSSIVKSDCSMPPPPPPPPPPADN